MAPTIRSQNNENRKNKTNNEDGTKTKNDTKRLKNGKQSQSLSQPVNIIDVN